MPFHDPYTEQSIVQPQRLCHLDLARKRANDRQSDGNQHKNIYDTAQNVIESRSEIRHQALHKRLYKGRPDRINKRVAEHMHERRVNGSACRLYRYIKMLERVDIIGKFPIGRPRNNRGFQFISVHQRFKQSPDQRKKHEYRVHNQQCEQHCHQRRKLFPRFFCLLRHFSSHCLFTHRKGPPFQVIFLSPKLPV